MGDHKERNGILLLGDISNYLKLTRNYTDMERAAYLNEFFKFTIKTVEDTGGELVKFIGDAFLAIYDGEKGIAGVKSKFEERYEMKWKEEKGSFIEGKFGNDAFSFRDIFGETVNRLFKE